jgi:hypothetical protein
VTYAPGLLCVIAACQCELDAHLAGCNSERCRGCLPLRAEKGSRACTACRLRAWDRLGELASLYDALLQPTRVPSGGGKASGGTERPQTLAEPAVRAREAIKVALVGWCCLLEEDLGAPLPEEDTVRAIVVHLLRHLRTLLGSEHAERLCEEIDELWSEGRRRAFPTGPSGQALGRCPACDTLVRSSTAHGDIRCRGCGQTRTVDEWQQLLVGDLAADASATLGDLASWLSTRYGRAVEIATLWQWTSRGVMVAGPDGARARVHLARTGDDPASRAALYSVADAARIGAGLYGAAKAGISA